MLQTTASGTRPQPNSETPRDDEAKQTESRSAGKGHMRPENEHEHPQKEHEHPQNEHEHPENENERRESVHDRNAPGDQDGDIECI
jgi:hypothetical protein